MNLTQGEEESAGMCVHHCSGCFRVDSDSFSVLANLSERRVVVLDQDLKVYVQTLR